MIWVWIAVLAVSLVLEAVTQELVCIWFAPGALIGLILAFFGVAQYVQISVVIAVSLVCLIFLRRMTMKLFQKNTTPCSDTKETNNPKEGSE